MIVLARVLALIAPSCCRRRASNVLLRLRCNHIFAQA
jgi:hypothetical protein